ncbi:hypothetical protein CTR2_R40030 [Comamonas thiooxydans]|uniref:hypothetical protein n=1 Tax=Comamonas thiooxydans TaxID=363952 RepID=UPI00111D668E|nr:hypothetical protein [Comamonas thiooxydans]BDR10665.1 hypothetical protein CTR2_R40030 [Comamonas thiooxydans]
MNESLLINNNIDSICEYYCEKCGSFKIHKVNLNSELIKKENDCIFHHNFRIIKCNSCDEKTFISEKYIDDNFYPVEDSLGNLVYEQLTEAETYSIRKIDFNAISYLNEKTSFRAREIYKDCCDAITAGNKLLASIYTRNLLEEIVRILRIANENSSNAKINQIVCQDKEKHSAESPASYRELDIHKNYQVKENSMENIKLAMLGIRDLIEFLYSIKLDNS